MSVIHGDLSISEVIQFYLNTYTQLRIHLSYHTTTQVLWGAGIGVGFGIFTYAILELVPKCYPESLIGRLRRGFLLHPIAIWIRIKDGWSVWEDGGREAEWQEWRKMYVRRQAGVSKKE